MISLHIGFIIFSFLVIFYTDKIALHWFLSKKETLDEKKMTLAHHLVWFGILGAIISGALIAYPRLDYLLGEKAFIIKILFVLALLVNAVFLGRLMKTAFTHSFNSLENEKKIEFVIAGMISVFSWLGALTMAFLI